MNSPGLLASISSSFENLVTLEISRLTIAESGFGVRSSSGRSEKFSDYQLKVVVLNFLKEISWCYCLLNRIYWIFSSILFDVWVWTSDIILHYYYIYYQFFIIVFINRKNLSVRADQVNSSLCQTKQFFDFIQKSQELRDTPLNWTVKLESKAYTLQKNLTASEVESPFD